MPLNNAIHDGQADAHALRMVGGGNEVDRVVAGDQRLALEEDRRESAGLERVGVIGEAFDPNRHEAVATIPAPSADKDHLVSAVFQPGYRFGGGLLRPARVQVQIWSEGA